MNKIHTIHNISSVTQTEEYISAKTFKNYISEFIDLTNEYKNQLRKAKQSKETIEKILNKKHENETTLKKKYEDVLQQLKYSNNKRYKQDIKKFNYKGMADMLLELRKQEPLNKKEMNEEYKKLAKKYL